MNWNRGLLLLFLVKISSAHAYSNVALRGKATQSSRFDNTFSNAINAIDGNRESDYSAGSCTLTIEQSNPWWRVDLLGNYIVTSITITNRGDCCADKLDGAEIHVGNSLLYNGAYNPVVAVLPHIPEGRSRTINFTGRVEGRHVAVVLPGLNRVLTLCEVEVYGYRAPTGENLAIYGKASQSSLYGNEIAYLAIDGNRAPTGGPRSCCHTNNDFSPWLRVDLGKTHKIFSVNVTNRIEYSTRLNGAELRIGDSLENNGNNNPSHAKRPNMLLAFGLSQYIPIAPNKVKFTSDQALPRARTKIRQVHINSSKLRCAFISSIPGGFTEGFDCHGMDGRYVNIVIPGRAEYLHVCEVEVYGSVLD